MDANKFEGYLGSVGELTPEQMQAVHKELFYHSSFDTFKSALEAAFDRIPNLDKDRFGKHPSISRLAATFRLRQLVNIFKRSVPR